MEATIRHYNNIEEVQDIREAGYNDFHESMSKMIPWYFNKEERRTNIKRLKL